MDIGVSLTRNGILTARQNGVIQHNDPPTTRLPTPVVLKIKATRASVKALRGYEHVGAAVSPSTNHTNTSQHERQGKVLTPCSQQACAVKCISRAFTLVGLRLEVFPALTGLFVQKQKERHTFSQLALPLYVFGTLNVQ